MVIVVSLHRDSYSSSWGFRLQGGVDFNQPLSIQKVFANTPADGELHRGDIVLKINQLDATHMVHKVAQDHIRQSGGTLILQIERGSSLMQRPQYTQGLTALNERGLYYGTHETKNYKPLAGYIPTCERVMQLYDDLIGKSTGDSPSYIGNLPNPTWGSYTIPKRKPVSFQSTEESASPTVITHQKDKYMMDRIQKTLDDIAISGGPLPPEDQYRFGAVANRTYRPISGGRGKYRTRGSSASPMSSATRQSSYSGNSGYDSNYTPAWKDTLSSAATSGHHALDGPVANKGRSAPSSEWPRGRGRRRRGGSAGATFGRVVPNPQRSAGALSPYQESSEAGSGYYDEPASERHPYHVSHQKVILQPVDRDPLSPDADTAQIVHAQFNSPLQMYSRENVEESLEQQTRGRPGHGTLQVIGSTGGKQQPKEGELYDIVHQQDTSYPEYHGHQPSKQSHSFKILQDLTHTDDYGTDY